MKKNGSLRRNSHSTSTEDGYLDLYGSGLMSNWELMISILTWLGAGMLVLSVILYLVGKKSDPIPEDDE